MGNDLRASTRAPSLVVEFIGVPGVGKSTLSHRVAALLRETGIACSEPTFEMDHGPTVRDRVARKVRFGFLGAIRHPSRVAAWISAVLASGQRSVPEAVRVTMNWCYLLEIVRRTRSTPGVHILDQGLFQSWWSLQYGARLPGPMPRELAVRLYPASATSTIVVALDSTVATALSRLRSRGRGGSRVDRDVASGGGAADPARRASAIYDLLLECVRLLETEPTLRTLRFANDGAEGIDQTARSIARDIAVRYMALGRTCSASESADARASAL